MKLTPLDIHHKEFRHSLRGYSEEEVDQFLDQVADEFERLFKENIELSERIDALQGKVNEFEMQRQTINNTLVTAQRSADDIVARASNEGEGVVRDAEVKAKEIIHNALSKRQQVANELVRIKQAEEGFRARYRSLLESQLTSLAEVSLPDDVSVLLGETDDGVLGDVAVQAPREPEAVPAPAAPVSFEAAPAAVPSAAGAAIESDLAPQPAQATTVMPVAEPPAPGFVQSVSLGEMEAPELPPGVELIEPTEYSLPGLDELGERESDSDIEEID